jgi:hypothetical protein
MPKTSQEMIEYRAKKSKYMRDYRQHATDVSSIINSVIANAIRIGQARDKCRDINHELALDSCADSLISDAINQAKNDVASEIVIVAPDVAHARQVVSKIEERKKKQREQKQAYRLKMRAEDEETYLNKQRDYRAKRKAEEQKCLAIVKNILH